MSKRFWSSSFVPFLLAGLVIFGAAANSKPDENLQRRGMQALRGHDFDRAERIFELLVNQNPTAANFDYLATAEAARGDYGRAILHFQKSIELGNNTPSVHYYLALACLKEKQFQPGIQQLKVALAENPSYFAARLALGIALLNTGRPAEARSEIESVKGPLVGNPWMWLNLVRAEFRSGETQIALGTIDQCLAALHDNLSLLEALTEVCLRHNQPQKAREFLENAVEAAPGNSKLKLLLADASLEAEEPEEAIAVLKNVPATAGTPGEVQFLLGSAFMAEGHTDKAAPHIAAALAAAPHDLEYISKYAELQALEKNYAGAVATLEKARAMQPDSPVLPYQLALVYVLMHHYQAALAACKEALRIAPGFGEAHFLQGAIEFNEDEWQAAQTAFRQALATDPTSALYHSALGAAFFRGGQLTEATKELGDALKLDPRTAPAYFWRANVSTREKRISKAIADLETFVALDSSYPQAFDDLARLYTTEGDTAKAAAATARYVALKEKSGATSVPFFLSELGMTRFRELRTRD